MSPSFGRACVVAVLLLAVGCTPSASPAPVDSGRVPAAAAVSQTPKVDWPQKGKTINIIVPFAAGGSADVHARLLAPMLATALGTSVEVVDVPGAGSAAGLAQLVQAPPDGYTLLMAPLPGILPTYVDATRGSSFGRKDIQPVSNQIIDAEVVAVKADGSYRSTKDLVDAAAANPGRVTVGDSGFESTDHLAILLFQKITGTNFAVTHFSGSGPAATALLGGHVDAVFGNLSNFVSLVNGGQVRVLGVMDTAESAVMPGVKTMEQQGYRINAAASRGIIVPAGTPKAITDKLDGAIKASGNDPDFKKKIEDMGVRFAYMGTAEYTAYWDSLEAQTRDLLKNVTAP